MSQLEIVRQDGTRLGTLDEVTGQVEMTEAWKGQRRKGEGQSESQTSEASEEKEESKDE